MKVSVIIVNYNTREYLVQNLVELLASPRPDYLDTEIIVLDNNSQDGSVAFLERRFPEVRVLSNRKNSGFAGGSNRAAQVATGEYLFFLNPDAKTTWADIGRAVKFAKYNREVGIVGAKITDFAGQPQASFGDFPSFGRELMESTRLARLFGGHVLWPRCYNRRRFKKTQVTDWVGGAGLLIRAKLFRRLKGFDEKYFLYFEDIDLCRRCAEVNYKVVYLPECQVKHIQGASGGNLKNAYRRSRYRYIQHNFKGLSKLLGLVLWPDRRLIKPLPIAARQRKASAPWAYTRYQYEPGGLRRLEYFLRQAGKRRLNILEIGAGSGNICLPLARAGHNVTALEPHKPTADKLRRYQRILSLKVVNSTIEEFTLKPEVRYDLIIVSEVLEHLIDPAAVLRSLKKLLKKRGRLAGSVPARNSLDEIGRWFLVKTTLGRAIKKPLKQHILDRGVQSLAESPHLHYFSLRRLKRLFRASSFSLTEIKTSTVFFREFYYVKGRFFMRRAGRLFRYLDKCDRRLSRHWPVWLGAGWMFTLKKK